VVRKIRRDGFIGKNILIACVIIALSTAGISYAYWNSGMNITALVSTGDLDVQFDPNTEYEVVNGSGNLSVTFQDSKTLLVEGTIEEAVKEVTEESEEMTIIRPEYSDHYGVLKFKIVNKGGVPAELVDSILENADGNVINCSDSKNTILFPQEDNRGNRMNQEIQISAGADKDTIDFNAEYTFNQPK
jgi:hypothetical protein